MLNLNLNLWILKYVDIVPSNLHKSDLDFVLTLCNFLAPVGDIHSNTRRQSLKVDVICVWSILFNFVLWKSLEFDLVSLLFCVSNAELAQLWALTGFQSGQLNWFREPGTIFAPGRIVNQSAKDLSTRTA